MANNNIADIVRDHLAQIIDGFKPHKEAERLYGIENSKFGRTVMRVVERKLWSFPHYQAELSQTAHDILLEVIEKLLINLDEGTSKRFHPDNWNKNGKDEGPTMKYVERYLMLGVQNVCNTKLRRGSFDSDTNTKDKGENAVTAIRKEGVRAREALPLDEPEENFWDKHLSTPPHDEIGDFDRVVKILKDRGITDEQLSLMEARFDGTSFEEMARERGGTADKYRKSFSRAMGKAKLGASEDN